MKIAIALIVAAVAGFAANPVLAQTVTNLNTLERLQRPLFVKPGAAGSNLELLVRIRNQLGDLMGEMRLLGPRKKSDPEATAMMQAMYLQAEYMAHVTAILYSHSGVARQVKVSAADKAKKTAADVLAAQNYGTYVALNNEQINFDGTVRKIVQQDKTLPLKDRGGSWVDIQLMLMTLRTQIDAVMLAELDD